VTCESEAVEEVQKQLSKHVGYSKAPERWSTPVHRQRWRNSQ